MGKDIRRHRMLLLGIAVLGVVLMVRWSTYENFLFMPLAQYGPVVLGLTLALFVHGDSAVPSVAYWRVQPLHPSAVFASKAVIAGIFAVALVIVQPLERPMGMGFEFGAQPGDRLMKVWTMCAVLAIAACTIDLAGFVVAWFCVYLSPLVNVMLLPSTGGLTPVSVSAFAGWALLGVLAMVAPLPIALYAYRNGPKRLTRIVLIAIVALSYNVTMLIRVLPQVLGGLGR
jgi:hypothetical protein